MRRNLDGGSTTGRLLCGRPGSPSIIRRRGLRFAFRGKVDEAISAFKQAALLDETLADAHAYLGMLYGIRGNWKDAIQAFQDAMEADPTYVEVYSELGEAYLNTLGSIDQAISPLEKAVQLHPHDERARRLLGTVISPHESD